MNETEKMRILIVDDERSNITILNHILKPAYSTLVAIDGKTAIEIARQTMPDLILLDIVMPDLSGYEVLTILKRDEAMCRIPVMIITALDSADDEEKGLNLGAADYITKPFHDTVVKARVKTHLKMVEYIREIERFGMTDMLTGLPNKRSFNERITAEWSRAKREKEPLSILMVDLDDFKTYNDTYGHLQGDIILANVADIFRSVVKRNGDFVCRWGGEEFAILLPNTDLDSAFFVAENIRKAMEKMAVATIDGKMTSVTVSIGVNCEVPLVNGEFSEFIAKADGLLYAAKKGGKNQVCR
jgi:diguanylate cyclase (GGDEF)-like protein